MTDEKVEKNESTECCNKHKWTKKHWHSNKNMGFGGFYCLTLVGVAVYYIQQSDTFWMGLLGFIKALVWPAMLIYKVFVLLNM